jgi:formylglycine-generating enzyme required for sulfatase activity
MGTTEANRRAGKVEVLVSEETEMVRVPSGAFTMGVPHGTDEADYIESVCIEDYRSSAAELCHQDHLWAASRPAREVHIEAFEIDRHEVRVSEYRQCVRAGGCDIGALLFGDQRYNKSDWPMVNVTWDDAQSYCRWRGKRLPTEAEWEKAARGSKNRRWPWGDRWRSGSANHGQLAADTVLVLKTIQSRGMPVLEAYEGDKSDGHPYAAEPGSMIWGDSPYGAADMAGNVREWVQDFYSEDGYEDLPAINPVRDSPRKSEKRRAVRGGSWTEPRLLSLSYIRFPRTATFRGRDLGFRCAL